MKTYQEIIRRIVAGTNHFFSAGAGRILCGIMAAASLTGCNEEHDPEAEPFLTVTPATSTIAFSAEANERYTFEVSTNQPVWLAISDQEWCKVAIDAQAGTFTVTALPNMTATLSPAATITVSAGQMNTKTITATQMAPTEYDVYVTGYYETQDFKQFACYWKNGILTKLSVPDETVSSQCTAISVSDGSVYMAGDIESRGCYWKDGQRVDLPSPGSGPYPAHSVACDNGTVYAGSQEFYWSDNTIRKAPGLFIAKDMAVSDGTVYMVGQLNLSVGSYNSSMAYYWKGGSAIQLNDPVTSKDSDATCVCASGGSFYAGGYYSSRDTKYACYWKDAVCTTLDSPQGMNICSVGGICVANGKVYAAGICENDTSSTACYWEDGQHKELELPSDAYNAAVSGIAVSGGRICIAGQYQDQTNDTRACVWIGGKRTDLPKGAEVKNAYVSGIAVVEK